MTLLEPPAEFVVALNDAAVRYGVQLDVGDRVAVARRLFARPVGTLSAGAVTEAFAKQGMHRLPRGFAGAVVARVGQLGGTRTFQDVLLEFRLWAIDALSTEFGRGNSKAREESLRNQLRGYLRTHAEVEARTGRGEYDLYVPELSTLIEVKIWTDRSTYEAGVEELGRYIHTKLPKAAFMVVFGDRDPLPAIATSHRDPFGERLELEGLTVPVIVVPFEGDAASKALANERARRRNG